tara:strand:+ start:13005 stop:13259 length:255 start_codon:yes stop_codon:yes gene_type:complete
MPMRIARRGQELGLICAMSENIAPVRVGSKLVGLTAKVADADSKLAGGTAITFQKSRIQFDSHGLSFWRPRSLRPYLKASSRHF